MTRTGPGPFTSFMTETATALSSIAVLTSGGDAGGMNPAIRAVVRTALHHGIDVYAVAEGYRGLIQGGDAIRRMESADVGGILQRGGTIIGTARSMEFRTREGRRRAARNLLERGIDALVVIGGDGSLTGANLLREEWPELLAELVDAGEVPPEVAAAHPFLRLVGLVGSIDNDMFGTDMTIGADTALHRIIEALDAIHSTASSHQRTFVVEVMGRHCGYLALMAVAGHRRELDAHPGAPPERDDWASRHVRSPAGRTGPAAAGRTWCWSPKGHRTATASRSRSARSSGCSRSGLGEDARVTILGPRPARRCAQRLRPVSGRRCSGTRRSSGC